MKKRLMSRRTFLKATGVAAVAATAGVRAYSSQIDAPRARVVLTRSEQVLVGGSPDPKVLEKMLDEALVELFGEKRAEDAWARLAGANDIVGIKTNVWRPLRTPPDLEAITMNRLLAVGVKSGNIGADDRGVLSNPIFQRATALINVRPMRAHAWSGVGGCLKNYIMFTPNPPDYHPDSCIDLGALWKLPAVKGKTRINILVMLTPQFHCLAPHHFDKEYLWPYHGLIVGTDPVAVDAVGLSIIEAKRRHYFKEDSPMRPPAKHISAAETKHGVGVADRERIDLVTLGWSEDRLI